MTREPIQIQNVGPIDSIAIPVPEGGGVVVLRGRNGAGKTLALAAAHKLVGRKAAVPIRDGRSSAKVEGLGVTVKLARGTSRRGELEVETLDGEDPSVLVDPRVKDPGAADRKRIEALCRLAGLEPDLGLFRTLIGNVEDHVSDKTKAAEDLPEMASRLKSDMEARAREAESEAERLRGKAEALRAGARDVDLTLADKGAALAKEQGEAVAELERLTQQEQADARAREAADAARAQLADAPVSVTVDEAEAKARQCAAEAADAAETLSKAREALAVAGERHAAALDQLEQVREQHETRQRWEDQIKASETLYGVTADDIGAARDRVKDATGRIEAAAVARKAKDDLVEAAHVESLIVGADREATLFRDAAGGVEVVLSDALSDAAPSGLRVDAGRLVMDTEERGLVEFHELSHGERWAVAIDVAQRAVGANGLLTIEQEAWEGLDPVARAEVVRLAKERDVVILTAECDEGALRAEEVSNDA